MRMSRIVFLAYTILPLGTAFVVPIPKPKRQQSRVKSSPTPMNSEEPSYVNRDNSYETPFPFAAPEQSLDLDEPSAEASLTVPIKETPSSEPPPKAQNPNQPKSIWETAAPVTIQGESLRTWSFRVPFIDRVQVLMTTEGRPLSADVELWNGPDNTPQKIRVYIEDGNTRPFCAVIETPGDHNAIAIRNTATLEYPLMACVEAEFDTDRRDLGCIDLKQITEKLLNTGTPRIVQGGAVYTKPFGPNVASVQVMLNTEGRPLLARIEILQGPNNSKQVMEIYTEHGQERPFFVVVETPGVGNIVRIVNQGTLEYPFTAYCDAYRIDQSIPNTSNGFFVIN